MYSNNSLASLVCCNCSGLELAVRPEGRESASLKHRLLEVRQIDRWRIPRRLCRGPDEPCAAIDATSGDGFRGRNAAASLKLTPCRSATQVQIRRIAQGRASSLTAARDAVMGRPIIAYCRVSTAAQGRSGLGLEPQREAVERFVAAEGFLEWPTAHGDSC
jgi:hypothetical protein